MPTYEYLCQTCSHRFETWQKMADEPLTACPECGAYIRRVLYPAGVVFKGSGFYKTDYSKNKSIPPTSNGESGESKKTDGATESKTSGESKPSSESKSGENGSSSSNTSSTSESKASTSTTK